MENEVELMLRNSVSLDENLRHQAFQTLSLNEINPEFIPCLLRIFGNTHDFQIRFLAISCCKNIVGRVYKSVPENNKAVIKSQLLSLAIGKYCPEIVHVIRKVARVEFPSRWNSLVEFLICYSGKLQDLSSEEISYFSEILYAVVKEQESKKLLAGRKESLSIGPLLVENIFPSWSQIYLRTPYRLDQCLLRLCRIGYSQFHLQPFHLVCLQLIFHKLSTITDSIAINKIWKDISTLHCAHPSAFSTIPIVNIGTQAIRKNEGREFPLTVIHNCVENNNFESFPIDLIAEKFLFLEEPDIQEWMNSPDDFLDGPLEGDPKRAEALSFFSTILENGKVFSNAVARAEKYFTENNFKAAEAWLSILILKPEKSFAIFSQLFTRFFSPNSVEENEFTFLIKFRTLQFLRACSSLLSAPEIEFVIKSLSTQVSVSGNICIGLSTFFAVKSLFDGSFDNPLWQEIGPSIFRLGTELLSRVNAPDVIWRILNAITLLSGNCGVSDINSPLMVQLFVSKDALVKGAIFDLLKAQLVASDDLEGVSETLLSTCVQIVNISLGSLLRSSSNNLTEEAEAVLDGACSLLTAIIRVSSESAITAIIVSNVIELLGRSIADLDIRSPFEALVEFNILAIESGVPVPRPMDQWTICSWCLGNADSVQESMLDEVFVLIELLALVDCRHEVVANVVSLISNVDLQDEIVEMITGLAASNQNNLGFIISNHPQRMEVLSILWSRLQSARILRTKVRLLNALIVLIPISENNKADIEKQLLHAVHVFESDTDAGELERLSSKVVSLMRSNRFEGMPKPVRREAFITSMRSVDLNTIKARLVSFSYSNLVLWCTVTLEFFVNDIRNGDLICPLGRECLVSTSG
jgi:hypothetical protein